MRIEEGPPIDDEFQHGEIFVESKSATDFKGFEALRSTAIDIDDQLLCFAPMLKWKLDRCTMRWSFEVLQQKR